MSHCASEFRTIALLVTILTKCPLKKIASQSQKSDSESRKRLTTRSMLWAYEAALSIQDPVAGTSPVLWGHQQGISQEHRSWPLFPPVTHWGATELRVKCGFLCSHPILFVKSLCYANIHFWFSACGTRMRVYREHTWQRLEVVGHISLLKNLCFWGRISSWIWNSLIVWISWSSSPGIAQRHMPPCWASRWVLGTQMRPSCLFSQYFTLGTSPSTWVIFFSF